MGHLRVCKKMSASSKRIYWSWIKHGSTEACWVERDKKFWPQRDLAPPVPIKVWENATQSERLKGNTPDGKVFFFFNFFLLLNLSSYFFFLPAMQYTKARRKNSNHSSALLGPFSGCTEQERLVEMDGHWELISMTMQFRQQRCPLPVEIREGFRRKIPLLQRKVIARDPNRPTSMEPNWWTSTGMTSILKSLCLSSQIIKFTV